MSFFSKENRINTLNGVLFVTLFAMLSIYLRDSIRILQDLKISPLIVAIVLGIIVGNLFRGNRFLERWSPGIVFSAKFILRGAIILYGFRLTFQQILAVGAPGLIVDLIMVISTFLIGAFVAIRLLKLDRETSFLTAAGASICGAAAVLATEPVIKAPAYKSAIAVSTVVLFGTIAMFLYPVLFQSGLLGSMDLPAYGIYVGATVHEVAHVVGAGVSCGMVSCDVSVIVKMGRVILLVPFLILFGWYLARTTAPVHGNNSGAKLVIPWFAFGFLAVAGFNSLALLPTEVIDPILFIDDLMLAIAMAALGLSTNLAKFKEVGMKPIYAGLVMFGWLLVGGYFITMGITSIMGSGGHIFGA